ncbi:hypothetical protein Bca101_096291 [Brassica carinata]
MYPSPSRLPSLRDSTTIPDLLKLRKLAAQALKAYRSIFESSHLSASVSVRRNSRLLCKFTELSKSPPLKPRKFAALTELSKSEVAFNSSPVVKLVKAKKDGFGGDRGTTDSMKVMSVKSGSNSLKVYV